MKRYLIAGLLVWVPIGITVWVLHFILTTLDLTLLLLPEVARPEKLFGFPIPGLGVVLAFAILLLVFGIRTGSTFYFEAALVISLLGFVATAALAKFLMRGEVIE